MAQPAEKEPTAQPAPGVTTRSSDDENRAPRSGWWRAGRRRRLILLLAVPLILTSVVLTRFAAEAAPATADGFASLNGGTTGGKGGTTVKATTGTAINQALCGRASADTPIIIQVEGTINHGNTTKVSGKSCDTAADQIELKNIKNVSIIGVGKGAVFDQLGIHVRGSSNIVIQNITVKNVKKSGSPLSNGGDAIGMENGVRNVWVDHVTLEASGGEAAGYDGLFDLKNDTDYVTLSYSILRNSGRGGLVGSSETDTTSSFLTFHHNLYQNLDSRAHLIRGATAHMYDNYFLGLNESGINSRAGAAVQVDSNYFKSSKDPLGTFYTNSRGTWEVSGNIFDAVTWSAEGNENHPAGPDVKSTGSVSIPYTFRADAASCVPDIVTRLSGAGKGVLASDGCSASTTTTKATTTTSTVAATTTSSGGATTTTPSSGANGTNLSLTAGADGSSKASGTSYGNVTDGDPATYWSPKGSTGQISVKWSTAQVVSQVAVREASGAVGNIKSWRLTNDQGTELASGAGAGPIQFAPVSVTRLNFIIVSSSGTPKVAEIEAYAAAPVTTTSVPQSTTSTSTTGSTGSTGSTTTTASTTPSTTRSGAIYVSPSGKATGSGSSSDPVTLEAAITKVAPGGTIYLRGGTYRYSQGIRIESTNSGTSAKRTELAAYPGETPVLDFSAMAEAPENRGLTVNGNYWHVVGLVVQHAGDNGIFIGGSNNIIERTVTQFNRDTGLQLSRMTSTTPKAQWPANNLILSAESHDNVDSTGENADGFAAKLTVGPGNVFRYAVSHNNIDDGWDLYTKTDTGAIGPVTIEDSLSYSNGTLTNGTKAANGDRNGFKLGGEDIAVDHIIRRNIAWRNGKHGFTYNRNLGNIAMTDNVSIDNTERNFSFDAGKSTFSGDVSCRFSGSTIDKTVGSLNSTNSFFTGSNGPACSRYAGKLSWTFDSSGRLQVSFA